MNGIAIKLTRTSEDMACVLNMQPVYSMIHFALNEKIIQKIMMNSDFKSSEWLKAASSLWSTQTAMT
ncbi:MAG: hypothetical protein ETSY2_42205 [Candidatus Entotheonella gemina]|uniref:Uncharacterized protein n=1 Tax=Candidatus Entotheonella gemina TaxID=1429439 RepID=W4LM78_9BACT|nr:MAG: hypothetical protein ETSY2_42205 [Candidatus Entotheonella gemina]